MAPSRFTKSSDRKREVTPFRDEGGPASLVPLRPTTPGPNRSSSPVDPNRPVTPAPPEWTSYDAPINFTWVIPDELCGMGWPKSRDQVRFLVEQGIDHLVSLSPEKIPPHYAFPDLKHTLIPVEDFTGPTIAEIQKFIEITDTARRDGEAVGVHCAEGRGRTGVMCACYLIYYYDMEPWDAIRIMRRQRPGSVERKVQEETVVRFYQLLSDYGKDSIDRLEQRDKQLMEMQRKAQAELIRNEALATQKATMNLMNHMHSFHMPQSAEAKQERIERMRRARSMPKLDIEEEPKVDLKLHVQSFLQGTNKVKRVKSKRGRDTDTDNDCSDTDRQRSRATTPGRALLEEVNLKPASERTIKNRLDPPPNQTEKCELKNHFRDFMRTPATVKRGRSFSQPRDKEGKVSGKEETNCLSRKESFTEKYTREGDQVKMELENHAKRLLQRRSLIKPARLQSDYESDNDSLTTSSHKTVDKESRDSSSEEELENSCSASTNNIVDIVNSPPPTISPAQSTENIESQAEDKPDFAKRKTFSDAADTELGQLKHQNNMRSSERVRSKSDVVPPSLYDPTSYDVELDVEQMLEDSWGLGASRSREARTEDRTRIRKNNVYNNNEYVYVDVKMKIGNTNPRPFTLSCQSGDTNKEKDRKLFSHQNSSECPQSKSYGENENCRSSSNKYKSQSQPEPLERNLQRLRVSEDKENRKHARERERSQRADKRSEDVEENKLSNNLASSFTARTTEILAACKNDIKKLTYRKMYMRSRSDHDRMKSKSVEKEKEESYAGEVSESGDTPVYTKYSSGSRIPNRPTTPGPYLEKYTTSSSSSPYIPKRPTTPGLFSRESWKRTNHKFNYAHISKYSGHETFV